MKATKKSQGSLQQSKITAFCLGNSRKRKNLSEEPLRCKTPELVVTSPERKKFKKEGFADENKNEDFLFEDFENDPFLSPKKDKSPRKNILKENGSQPLEDEWNEKSEINFENAVRCKFLKSTIVAKGRFEQIILVEDEKLGQKGVCKLRDVWTCSSFSLGDAISIQAVQTEDGWVVDNKNGYVVLFPDVVISSTSLVTSLFCMRQGVLGNFFKGIDSTGNDRMLIGRLVHEFLQECLKTQSSGKDLSSIIKSLIESRDYFRDFYFSDLKMSQIQKEMEDFVPHVNNFLDIYVHGKLQPTGKNFKGSIDKILDIEELIRSPTLGVQGRIDVTVGIKSKNMEKVAPLELKTGKASFSNEHKSQLTLYVLLMNELGRKVESGLLLYLKEDTMEEIIPQRDEIRNLFLLRNQVVGYFKSKEWNLPEPIRNEKGCSRCPYLRVCTTYLKEENKLTDSHPLSNIETPDVLPSHVKYFVEWNKMLWLEFGEAFKEESDQELSNLKLDPNIEISRNEFKHKFRKSDLSQGKELSVGKYVHILNSKSNRIGSGKIVEVSDAFVCVLTEKKLDDTSDLYKIVVFQMKFLNFYLSNLGLFLDEQFKHLREIIIDKKAPTFRTKMDKKDFKDKCLKNLIALNKEQQRAVLKSILCNDYLLIKGPPGTGKTQTIVVLIRILVALGKRVLIASHTNTSVDNILVRLNDVEFLRLGSLKSIHKDVHYSCYATLIEKCKNVEDVKKLFGRRVVASTCSGLDADFIRKEKFDYCIVDESSQVLQPEILRPLFCSEKFILVGDEDQLPPIVQNIEAKKMGMDKSMFEWLTNDKITAVLKYQYRMNSVINSLANSIAYDGLIQCADEKVANATLNYPNSKAYSESDEWVRKVLSSDLDKSVIFVETSNYFQLDVKSAPRSSILEANIILALVSSLIKFGLKEESIGVIAPFCDQVAVLKAKLEKEKLFGVELNTVDQYQGRDKRVILFSCTKENQSGREVTESELLNDKRRLTVAVTRAKHKLILVGDTRTVNKYQPFQNLVSSLTESQFVRLSDGEENFFWENFNK